MIGRKKMSGFISALSLLCFVGAAYGQEDYTAWAHHATITLNTSSTGANVAGNVVKFPVLIRLNSSNFAGFSQLTYSGTKPIDIRFSKGSDITRHFPYQIEYWSQTKDTAVIWVLVDTVFGNNAAQTITMHYGNNSALDSSNGKTVFDTANGYKGVWHLADSADATFDGYNGTGGTSTDVPGMIGRARSFNGTSSYMQIGTSTNSKISSNSMPYGGPWTLSAWVYFNPGTTVQSAIAGAGDYAYQIQRNQKGIWSSADYAKNSGWVDVEGLVPTPSIWHHVVGVRNNLGSSPYVESLFVDGAFITSTWLTNTNGSNRNSLPFCIGALPTGTPGHYLSGSIDEVEVATLPRTSDWVKISYQNQQANQTLVTVITPTPPVPVLSSPTNGAAGQPVSLNLSWNSIIPTAGTASYSIQVSTASDFSSTILGLTGLASTSVGISSLSNSATYFWKVSATDGNGTSAWAVAWSFGTVQMVPSAPSLSSPSNGATFANGDPLTVSWSSVATATSYTVQVAITTDFFTTITTFSQSGLTTSFDTILPRSGVVNYWRVSATNPAGMGAWSPVWTLTPTVSVAEQAILRVDGYEFSMKQGMIVYSLPKAGQVELTICDMLGRTAMATSRMQEAGHYTIDLRNSPLASGRYTVRFKAGAVEKRAMVMLTR